MPYLGWGGCGLGSGVTFGFRASTVPGFGTTALIAAESGKVKDAEAVPRWSAENEQNWKIFLLPHSQILFFTRENSLLACIKRWENSELMRAPGCWDKSNLPQFWGTFRFFPFLFQFYLFPHHFHKADISVYGSGRQQVLLFYLFFYYFLLPELLAHLSVPPVFR